MKTFPFCLLAAVCLLLPNVGAKPLDIVGSDAADGYGSGWTAESGTGSGFGKWTMQTSTVPDAANSHAGFYIASTSEKSDLKGAALSDKAFGLYANGTGFECAAAFRPFEKPLKIGQSFSFLMEHGDIVKKFDTDDPSGGSIGLTLRATNDSDSHEDYNKESRFEIGYYKPASAYIIYDGDGTKQLDMPLAKGGLGVTLTLTGPDTYDLEITVLATRQTTKLTGRKLGGTPGAPIKSFCLFDRNGETNDAYFNGFQILQEAH